MLGPHRLGSIGKGVLAPPPSGKQLSPQAQQQALRQFISRVGGVQNAKDALAMLALLEQCRDSKPLDG